MVRQAGRTPRGLRCLPCPGIFFLWLVRSMGTGTVHLHVHSRRHEQSFGDARFESLELSSTAFCHPLPGFLPFLLKSMTS